VIADTLRVELVWRFGVIDFAVNVLHFTTGAGDPLTQAMVDAMGADIEAAFVSSSFDDQYSTESELDRIVVRDLRTDGNGPVSFQLDHSGTIAENPCPAQTCVVTTLRTTNGTRRGRGRIYWPAPASNKTTASGGVAPALSDAATDFTEALLLVSAGALGNVALGVYSRADDITRTVTDVNTDSVFDVQVRRRDLSIV